MDTFENFIPGVNSCGATSQFDLDPSAEKVSQEVLHKPFEMLKQELISENPKPTEYANFKLGTVEVDVRETCESDHNHILKPEMITALNDMLAKAANTKFSHMYCESKVLAEQQKILSLFKHGCGLPGCSGRNEVVSHNIDDGGVLKVTWKCSYGHRGKWESSSVISEKGGQKLYSVPFQIASSVFFTGNNFDKVKVFTEFLSWDVISQRTFQRYQSSYLIPAIQELYDEMIKSIHNVLKNVEDACLCGDGRNDSPGHSAKFCTYTMMERALDIIMDMEVVDKRETGGTSVTMETSGLRRTVECLKDALKIKEVVTDASASVIKLLRDLRGENISV